MIMLMIYKSVLPILTGEGSRQATHNADDVVRDTSNDNSLGAETSRGSFGDNDVAHRSDGSLVHDGKDQKQDTDTPSGARIVERDEAETANDQ